MAKHEAKQDDAEPSIRIVRKPTRHKLAKGLFAGGVALAAYGLVYAGGNSYFSTHFVPGTTLNGKDVSWLTEAQAAQLINGETDSYSNDVTAGELEFSLQASDIGFSSDGEACAHDAMEQNQSAPWPLRLVGDSDIEVETGIEFDEKALQSAVEQVVAEYNKQASDPEDAEAAYDDDNTSFYVKQGEPGTKLKADAVVSAVRASVATQHSTTHPADAEVLVEPQRGADDPQLNETVDRANDMLELEIPLVVGDDEQTLVSREQIAQWVEIDDELNVQVDEEAIAAWADETLASETNRSDDDYDYTLNANATAAALMQNLEDGSSDAVEVEVTATKKVEEKETTKTPSASWDKSRGRYIDVDLANQYARLYDASGSVIWESYVVSGDTGVGRGTPVGTFSIYAKETNRELVGMDYNNDGLPDYRSFVNYWMPFSGGYGLHDATWRDSFGGSIYSYAGSHGCVNLPYDAAASLFSMVSVGETVVVHW
ncbi:MAG: L,D-transpeptidase [Coriobacteriales bacterium]|nr:L,D-transpeptidase [Coriobacteriales bacterium]